MSHRSPTAPRQPIRDPTPGLSDPDGGGTRGELGRKPRCQARKVHVGEALKASERATSRPGTKAGLMGA